MNVKIIDILEKSISGYKVILEIDNERITVEWDGSKPEKNVEYSIEIDIDDELIWNNNIALATESTTSIKQDENHINIVAKLDYNHEDNLASLNMNGSVVLIDLDGMNKDISNEWVKIQCSSIKVYNINL
ncbi:hypothetical protein [Clostridium cibarium]|uniref:Uncharacterized protein n=1 Tax=Clostridium cibarium TaxID=2762247 RepID=A0ABR8PVC6_9CLOT|nr:hypothetical protein [Clostridium cibarium]MBD7912100.1 hypothetical protein [Clostridium cibarium]